jgi:hypothetical protein
LIAGKAVSNKSHSFSNHFAKLSPVMFTPALSRAAAALPSS